MKLTLSILTLVLLIIFPAYVYAAPAFVQGWYGENSGTSVTVSFQSNVTAGNMIVAVTGPSDTTAATTCTSGGRSFNHDAQKVHMSRNLNVLSLANTVGGATSVTCSGQSSDGWRLTVLEFSGVATSGQTVDFATNSGNGGIPNAGPVTTVSTNSLLLFAAGSDSDEYHTVPSPGSGWTLINIWAVIPGTASDPDKTAEQFRVASTTGNYSSQFTSVSAASWAAVLVAYLPADGVPPPPPPLKVPNSPGNIQVN